MSVRFLWTSAIAVSLCLAVHQVHAFDVPRNDGFVTDTMQLLSEQHEEQLEQKLSAYAKETTNEIAVAIFSDLSEEVIADIAVTLGREWGVGTAEFNNGIVIVLDYRNRDVFIATGYGLEGAVPDLVAKGIIDTDIVPHFRNGNYVEGLQAATVSLQKHIGGEYTAERYQSDASGFQFLQFIVFMFFVFFDYIAAFLARTKSWWLGAIAGIMLGLIFLALFNWWLAIPLLSGLGALFDYLVSKHGWDTSGRRRGRRSPWTGSSGGRRGGGGGFGGFGGGSFGGG